MIWNPAASTARLGAMRRAAVLLLALAAGCAPGEKRRTPSALGRTVVAIYTEVEGVSFSTDGEPYARFTDFIDREECIRMSLEDITKIIDSLEREGFFKEESRKLKGVSRVKPPMQFRICIASPEKSKECLFLSALDQNVPPKLRDVLAAIPMSQRPSALEKFLLLNREIDR